MNITNSILRRLKTVLKRTSLVSQCANHFDHLGVLPKFGTNHTVNLARSHTGT